MNLIEFLQSMQFYSMDVLIVAIAVDAIVILLKRTLLKNCKRTFLTILPFAIGIIIYAVYQAIAHGSISFVLENWKSITEYGFGAGCASVFYFVFYSQFIAGTTSLTGNAAVIATLLDDFCEKDKKNKLAQNIADVISADFDEDDVCAVINLLTENAPKEYTDGEINVLANLIVQTLKTANKKTSS